MGKRLSAFRCLFAVLALMLATGLPGQAQTNCPERSIRVASVTEVAGREVVAIISLTGAGTENALSFSLSFDSARLTYRGESAGAGAIGASLLVNTNQLGAGRLGYALARPGGQRFAAGSNELLRLRFLLEGSASTTAVAFADAPLGREVVDDAAGTLCASYSNGVVNITPLIAPAIITQPTNQSAIPGQNVSFIAAASGSTPLLYQWLFGNSPLANATNTTLTLTSVTTNQAGSYLVIVSNDGGSATSTVATLTVNIPPVITVQPQGRAASTGEVAVFTVAATGTGPLLYQWRKNGANFAGRTNASLIFTNLATSDAATYLVVVSNPGGSVTSENATLTVSATPRTVRMLDRTTITGAELDVPVELTGFGDENAVGFSVSFDPQLLIWRGATLGSGAAGGALNLNDSAAGAGRVGLAVTRLAGQTFAAGVSQIAVLKFQVGGLSGGAAVVFADDPIVRDLADVVGESRRAAWSNAVITVLTTPPAIVTQPQSQTNRIFDTAALAVAASGSVPLLYQWQRNGANVPGATNASLTLPGVRPALAGNYRVIVSNLVGVVTSQVATLTVPRVVRVANTNAATGTDFDLPVELLANGDETALGFSLRFDVSRMAFRGTATNIPGFSLNVNSNATLAGVLGFAASPGVGLGFALGTQTVARLRFASLGGAGDAAITFADTPVFRELVDAGADALLTDFLPGTAALRHVAPVITQQPLELDVFQGTSVSFSLMAEGSLPLAFQWKRNGSNLPGETNRILTIPNVLISQSGSYVAEVSNAGGVTNSAPAILTVRPPPGDLFVTRIDVPTNIIAGQPVTVTWVVTNVSAVAAVAPWRDTMFLADDASGANLRTLGNVTFFTGLAANSSITRTGVVIVPVAAHGMRFFGVTVDTGFQVPESNEGNNTFISVSPVQVQAADLAATGAVLRDLSGSQTNAATFGQTLQLSWIVNNVGDAPALAPWSDRVFFSRSATSLVDALPLVTLPAPVNPLSAAQGYAQSRNVALPSSSTQFAPGDYFLVVAVDHGGSQVELDELNNTIAVPLNVQYPPLPDLVPANVSSPSNAFPGQTIAVSWTLTNAGPAAASSPWTETIRIVPDEVTRLTNSTQVQSLLASAATLGTFAYSNTLAAGAFLTRTQFVTLPVSGVSGDTRLFVTVDARDEVFEENETNNVTIAGNVLRVPVSLTLQLSSAQISEDATVPLRATLTRNGSIAQSLTVTVSNSHPGELSFVQSLLTSAATNIMIPAGQSVVVFNLYAVADHIVDAHQLVIIGATASSYDPASASVTVLNVDLPTLTLTAATNSVVEGFTVAMTVTRDVVTSNALTVALSSSSPGQLSPPNFVTIPAGAASTTSAVLAVDDVNAEATSTYSISASTAGFNSGLMNVTVLDNDVPQLTVSLSTHSVSEGAGAQALSMTVTRNPVGAGALNIEPEAGDPSLVVTPLRITIPPGQSSRSFPIGVIDDTLVNGSRMVAIGAYALAAGSGARLASSAPEVLTVTDDDGPTLKLTAALKLVREGLNPATIVTVTRNTPATNDLVVSLSTSRTNEATVPASVTISNGAVSATFPLTSVADGTNDGNQIVTLTALATNFTPGTETVVVSDTDLPDLVVASITAPASAVPQQRASVGYRLANQGLSATAGGFLTRVYLSRDAVVGGDDILVAQFRNTNAVAVGQFIESTEQIDLPLAVGNYWVVVETDAEQTLAEVLEDNNTRISATPIAVAADYAAWVRTDVTNAPANTPVPLYGRATNSLGAAVAGKSVSLHLLVRGTQRILSATTDANGNFTTIFTPLPGEAGRYDLFATHPGVSTVPVQDTFSLLGFRANPASVSLTVIEGSSRSGSVSLENLSDVPLTGLAVQVVSKPANLQVTTTIPNPQLSTQTPLNYQLSATTADAYGTVQLRVTTAEGVSQDIYFGVSVEPLRPRLVATPVSLYAAMPVGGQAVVEFDVANLGGRDSGPITLSLPAVPWMHMASTNPMPSLAPGQTNRVTLLLTPARDLPLLLHSGSIALNAERTGVAVPFGFRAMSLCVGDLRVEAVDEFTYYAEGAPRLAGATVTVRDTVTGTNVASGVTGTNGLFSLSQLPEGYYDIEVRAERHTGYRATHLLRAGLTNEVQAFLSRQTVTYTWTVEPVTLEDRYRIIIETTFEAVVPVPVITIEPSVIDLAGITADETRIDIKVTNHGLIAANNTRIGVPTLPLWQFSPLIDQIGVLPARSSITVPMTIRRLGSGGAFRLVPAAESPDVGPCYASFTVCWDLVCGTWNNTYCATIAIANARHGCGRIGPTPPAPSPPRVTCIDCQVGTNSATYTPPASVGAPLICDPSCLFFAVLSCVPGPIGCVAGGAGCIDGLFDGDSDPLDYLDCLLVVPGCIPVPTPLSVATCAYSILRCVLPSPNFASAGFSADSVAPYVAGTGAFLNGLNEITGGESNGWFTAASGPLFGDWFQKFSEAALATSESGRAISISERQVLLSQVPPEGISTSQVLAFLERRNRTLDNWSLGILYRTNAPAGISRDFVDFGRLREHLLEFKSSNELAVRNGYSDSINAIAETVRAQAAAGQGGGDCARVKLRLEQGAVITRDGFRATLELDNNGPSRLENLRVTVNIRPEAGAADTNLFAVRFEGATTLSGVDGTGILAGNSSGIARWLIIPTVDAAPQVAARFFVGGTLSYRLDGNDATVNISEVPITVLPNPRLTLKYFHQRDVFSDDPFTDIIEPAIPYSLAVMVQNRGYGEAKNFRVTSAQPKIIENDKGLLIDFNIIATEVAGQAVSPSLTATFGNISAGATAIGRWLLTSPLQGLFIDYQATWEHIDGLGNPRLSLIDEVTIHEMNHLVQAGGIWEDGKPDFLVNQVPDVRDLPDTLYHSNGSTNPVALVEQASVAGALSPGNLQVSMTAPVPGDWVYLRVPDPGNGQYRLIRVTRSDGVVLTLHTNVWTTDRTFVGLSHQPIRENILHLLDYNSPGSYTLTYEPGTTTIIDTNPPTSTVSNLPSSIRPYFQVSWSGRDEGPLGQPVAGIAYYHIYVSENNGPFTPWLQQTPLVSATYIGMLGSRYAFYSVATDANGNREASPGTPDATTFVSISNSPPSITITNMVTIDEGMTLDLPFTVTDADTNQFLTVTLLGDAPPGVHLNAAGRRLTWPTGEANGPSTNVLTLAVRDDDFPSLSATGRVTLVVNEVNSPPTLGVVTNRTINEGRLLSFTVSASDNDLPRQTLTFSLASGFPSGVVIDGTNGIFTWRPTEFQGGTTNRVSIIAQDNGTPSLYATQTFNVVVRDTQGDFTFAIGSTNLLLGGSNTVALAFNSGVEITNLSLVLDTDATQLIGLTLQELANDIGSSSIEPIGLNRSQLRFTVRAGETLLGPVTLARLGFIARSNAHSAIVTLHGSDVVGTLISGLILANPRTIDGRVFVIGQEPLLDAVLATNGGRSLVLYGHPGEAYEIQSSTNLNQPPVWQPAHGMELITTFDTWSDLPIANSQIYYRAVQLSSPSVNRIAGLTRLPDGRLQFQFAGVAGRTYVIEASTNLLNWQTIGTNASPVNFTTPLGATEPYRFFRLKTHP